MCRQKQNIFISKRCTTREKKFHPHFQGLCLCQRAMVFILENWEVCLVYFIKWRPLCQITNEYGGQNKKYWQHPTIKSQHNPDKDEKANEYPQVK